MPLMDERQQVSWKARQEIILCAGSVGSPGILQRSGIGPSSVLKPLGIEVLHELPGVGGNLQDHLQLRLIYKLENARTLLACFPAHLLPVLASDHL